MRNIQARLEQLERANKPGVIHVITTPGTEGYYRGQEHYATIEEARRAFPGREVIPVTLNILMDLSEI